MDLGEGGSTPEAGTDSLDVPLLVSVLIFNENRSGKQGFLLLPGVNGDGQW